MQKNVVKSKYKVIGMMSGTSLDGLDLAYCVFQNGASGWKYTIEKTATLKYSSDWLAKLSQAHTLPGVELMALDAAYGSYLGKAARAFADKHALKPDFIASHGHTVFHQPQKKFTTQIGNGFNLHAACMIPVVCDFRMQDVAFGGEGAPLVPAGDKFLFHQYDVCLNLGGIANLSVDVKGKRMAFDICFCNMGLNYLAAEAGKKYDKGGALAAAGAVNDKMLASLQKVYRKCRKKRPSLGREIFETDILSLLDDKQIPLEDRICTFTESSAREICEAIKEHKHNAQVLCTGGGAFNAFLIARMLDNGEDDMTFIIPEDDVVKFKEALVFGFLGVLRVRDEVNCLRSVTHALRDTSSGTMIGF
ncbi:MAG TPA: anhydro-N-acetylmuramic acid kinase [Chryseosolibacter sp.]|nr:anhydro-N-acetylmuramic acid kinase [Chryseosolibacter sp.]